MTPIWLDKVYRWIAFRLPRRIVFYAHFRWESDLMTEKVKADKEQKS